MKLVNFTLRFPDELHEALSASAKDRGKSLNGLICELLARGMTEHGLRRSLVEAVRQEIRAEYEARRAPVAYGQAINKNALNNAPPNVDPMHWYLTEGFNEGAGWKGDFRTD